MDTTVSDLNITEVKHIIDARLEEYCSLRSLAAEQMSPRYSLLWQTISQLLQAGGKRFRPFMLVSAYKAYSGSDTFDAVLPAALAQELIHQAMLIHDDIIDRDTMRYGIKNISGQYNDLYTPLLSNKNERAHMTESAALLAGDVLLSDAYQLLSESQVEKSRLTQATAIFSHSVFEVVGGELLDTENSFLGDDEHISAKTIARYKTASYTFISPLTIGAVLGGASAEELQLLKQFSEYVGLGYQLRDDLLGVFGDTTVTGKSASGDIAEGKATYLIEQFEQVAQPEQKNTLMRAFHNEQATERELAEARTALIESGAKQKVEDKINELLTRASESIERLSIADDHKSLLRTLATRCLNREY